MPETCSCLVCLSTSVSSILDPFRVPTDTIRLWATKAEAQSATKAEICLTKCDECGHIFNRAYRDELVDYETDYENSQMFSPRFRQYAEQLADRLIQTYGLSGKQILEIGGGKGDFLRIICDRGRNRGVSFGPSYRPAPDEVIPENLRFVTDYYDARYKDEPADLIVCRHVLEHFWEPRKFISTIRQAVANRSDLIIYFEVPNGDYILQRQAFWEIIYQHCSYFTKASLTRLFREFGFTVRRIQESFGEQFLSIELSARSDNREDLSQAGEEAGNGRLAKTVHKGNDGAVRSESGELGVGLMSAPHPAVPRPSVLNEAATSWRNRLESLRSGGKRVIAWGAGAKAVTFLNMVDPLGTSISHIVDINPRKVGHFVPGSAQEIVAPDALAHLRPDTIVLMNGIYREEVCSIVNGLGIKPEIVVA